jgi:nucleoside 2-deoxyribosyltransferase
MSKIYLASPFFQEKEIKHVERAEQILRGKGHLVFSPRENQLDDVEFGSREWRTDVFRNDINHIKWCDYVVAILTQGNYDDAGTAMEVGYAYALGKPIIVYNPEKNMQNLMISDSLHAYIEEEHELLTYNFETMQIKPYTKEVI